MKINILLGSLLGLLIIICLIYLTLTSQKQNEGLERFESDLFKDPQYEKNRTLLYGSLFLDKLNKQIKNLTDPPIQYDNKRIDIIKYSDILL